MLKNKVRSIVAGCCAAALCLMSTTGAYAATSRSWSVHAQPGSYQTTQVVSIVNFGNGYVASCTAMSGDVASKSTTIREYSNSACTNAVALNKTVTFTCKGTDSTEQDKTNPNFATGKVVMQYVEKSSGNYIDIQHIE